MKRSTISCWLLGIGVLGIVASLTWSHWWILLHPLVYDAVGEHHRAGAMRFISWLVREVAAAFEIGGLWGTPLVVAVMPGCFLRLREPFSSWRYTFTLAGAGLLLTGISIAISLDLFFIEPGSSIRPMMWAMQQFLLLFAGIAAAAWFGPWHVNSEAPKWLRWLGVLLCLAPFPAGGLMLRWAMARNGLVMSE